jgi:hypothetical protein
MEGRPSVEARHSGRSGRSEGGSGVRRQSDGTVEKAIFSISCTTCQTRLAVRSEAAIGQILECPKCQSMVQVVPPPGWTPAPPPPPAESPPHGPPPLDRVAADDVAVPLEPVGESLASRLLSQTWLIWGVGAAVVCAAVCTTCWLTLHSESPQGEPGAVAVGGSGRNAGDSHDVPPGPQSGGVVPPKPATESPLKSAPDEAAKRAAEPPPAALPKVAAPPTPEVKPAAKQNPLPAAAKEPVGEEAAKEGQDEDNTEKAAKDDEKTRKETAANRKPEQPEVKKSPAAAVDVAARMADPLRGLELTDVPLARALDLLGTISTLPISLDPDALRQVGATPHDHVSVKLDSATVEQALQAIAAERGLAVSIDNDQVIITLPAKTRETLNETLKSIRYTVSDLTGDDKGALAEFATLVQTLVAPESWQAAGGRGTIKSDDGALVISQTGGVHQQVLVFCEKLRNARHKPLRSRDAPEKFVLTTRTAQARKMLDSPVTVNFHEPTPLAKILAFLAEATGSAVLIDRAALAAADTSDRVETSLTVEKKPLGVALGNLLAPLGLAYRVVGPNAIQVTTKDACTERLELEFYPLGQRAPAANLIEQIKVQVAPAAWGEGGEAYYDIPSRCLIVLQSQPVQAEIERFLATMQE